MRAEGIVEIIEELARLNLGVPVVVEGKRDEQALRELGLTGRIITFHRGIGVMEFCERMDAECERLVLLMDWDRAGDELQRKLERELAGRWEKFASLRERLLKLCQRDVNDIEGLPALLRRLREYEEAGQ